MPGLESRRLRRAPPLRRPAPAAGDVYVGGWGSAARTMPGGRVPLALERPSVGGWRAFRRVTVVTVDRWNSGTAGRCSGNSLQRHNVVTS